VEKVRHHFFLGRPVGIEEDMVDVAVEDVLIVG
jgi:hypothetical protein